LEDPFHATFDSAQKASKYVGQAEYMRDAVGMLNNSEVRKQIEKRYGSKYNQYLANYLNSVTRSPVQEEVGESAATKFGRTGFANFALALNPWVAAKQVPSYMLAWSDVGTVPMAQAIGSPMSEKRASEVSPLLRSRFEGNFNREIGDLMARNAAEKFYTGKTTLKGAQDVLNKSMALIGFMDSLTVRTIARAVELELKASPKYKGQDTNTQEFKDDLALRITEVIDKTQPTYDLETRSAWGRAQNPLLKYVTMFGTQRNKIVNMLSQAAIKGDAKTWAKTAGPVIGSAAMIGLIDTLRKYLREDEDKREELGILKETGKNTIYNTLGNLYMVGDASTALAKGLMDPESRTYPEQTPFAQVITTVNEVMNLIGQIDDDKKRKDFIKRLSDLTSMTTKIPSSQINRLIKDFTGVDMLKEVSDAFDEDKKTDKSSSSKGGSGVVVKGQTF